MPDLPLRPCAQPGCGALVAHGRCDAHQRQYRRLHDAHRGSSAKRGYGAAWQRARAVYLAQHPLCVRCEQRGRIESATVVDHKVPHRGDPALMWDEQNWQALCKPCHDHKTVTEDGGFGR